MSTGYRIARWAELYEPSRHDVRHNGPLRFVKAYVHGGDQSASCRNLIRLSMQPRDDGAAATARDAFCLFIKLLEMAGNEPRGKRDGTVFAGELPADLDSITGRLWPLFDDSAQVAACLELLCHPDVGWVERFDRSAAADGGPAASAGRKRGVDSGSIDAANSDSGRTSGTTGASAGRTGGVDGAQERRRDGVTGAQPGRPNGTVTVTELNKNDNGTGTGACEMREMCRTGPEPAGAELDTRGDRRRPGAEGHAQRVSLLSRFGGPPEVWVVKAVELLCRECRLDAAARSQQTQAITAVMSRAARYPHREELAATLIDAARTRLRTQVLRNPWAAWQRAAEAELHKRGLMGTAAGK